MSDPSRFEIPGHVTIATGNGGLPKILIETAASTAEIYPHGATVTAFGKKGEPPLLFLSGASAFSRTRPIRGGIPLIFPWFGQREGLPSHGFARTAEWELRGTRLLDDGSVEVRLTMPPFEHHEVHYTVVIGRTLDLSLEVRNEGEKDFTFETCFHSYFQVGSIDRVEITGLKNTGYHDKVRETGALETDPVLRITGETDRVYFDTQAEVGIVDPVLGRVIRITKTGSLSTVVWNPWIAKSREMPDFGDEEFRQMLCVESGNIGKNQITLPPHGRSMLKVRIASEKAG